MTTWYVCTSENNPTILVNKNENIPEGYSISCETANPDYLSENKNIVSSSSILTILDFRSRFTLNEKVAIELESVDDVTKSIEDRKKSAMIRIFMKDLETAQFIDLDNPSVKTGVLLLEQLGILASGRSFNILKPE